MASVARASITKRSKSASRAPRDDSQSTARVAQTHSFFFLHANKHSNPFKMVKMVENAEEFNTLKKGDKPVRPLFPRTMMTQLADEMTHG